MNIDQSKVVSFKRRAGSGTETLLRQVVRDHEVALRRFLRARLANHPDYEDLAQEVFLKLARRDDLDDKLKFGEAQTRSYLFRMASNLIADRYRSNQARADQPVDEVDRIDLHRQMPSIEESAGWGQELEAMKKAIMKLEPATRRAFLLSRIENLSYRQIADEMGISISMVEKHMMNALAYLRARVDIG